MGFFDVVKKIVGIPVSRNSAIIPAVKNIPVYDAKLKLVSEEFRMFHLKAEAFSQRMQTNCNKYTLPVWQKKFYTEILGEYLILLQRTERDAHKVGFELPFKVEMITTHYFALKPKVYTFTLDPFKSLAKSELTHIQFECKNVMIAMKKQIEINIVSPSAVRKAS